jgi:putative hydrolases of HD superfamily
LAKDLDKFEMILQAFEYEKANKGMSLDDFFNSTKGKFKNAVVVDLVMELYKERDEFLKRAAMH